MWKYGIFLFFSFFFLNNSLAATIKCTATNMTDKTLDLPQYSSTDRVSVSGNYSANTFRKLYTYTRVYVLGGPQAVTCTKGSIGVAAYIEPETTRREPWVNGNYIIFPTSVSGIGISFNDSSVNDVALKSYTDTPLYRWSGTNSGTTTGNWHMHVEINLWRTPEPLGNPGSDGLFRFGPFRIVHAFQATNVNDAFTADSTSTGNALLPRSITTAALSVNGGINLISGTCDMAIKHKTVRMGTLNAGTPSSPWVDASFALSCPRAWGYGAISTLTGDGWKDASGPTNAITKYTSQAISKQNVTIQVIPYVSPSNSAYAAQGILDLDPGGATGYGIQLAWGFPSEQGNIASRPVPLGTYVNASTLNNNFNTNLTNIGEYALLPDADGTIPMSARYIRTTGDIRAGLANGKVEVIATYD